MYRKPKIREPYTAAELRLINACLVALQYEQRESEPARLSLELPADDYADRAAVTAYRMHRNGN